MHITCKLSAADKSYLQIVRALLTKGVDINFPDGERWNVM